MNINRKIREMFQVTVRNDFSPIGCHKGDRNTLVKLWNMAGYKIGCEIGVHRAGYSKVILDTIPESHLHCIDPWGTYRDSHFTEDGQNKNFDIAMKTISAYGDRVTVHRNYSQDIHANFKDGELDFLFIDGMHTFDGCALDLIYYVPKVRKGGMVAVHDYCAQRRGGVIESVDGYTKCHLISPWYVTREIIPTAFWVV
jgi:hypothetical protein